MNKLNSVADLFSLEANESVLSSNNIAAAITAETEIAATDNAVSSTGKYLPYSQRDDKFMSVNQDELRAQFDYKDRPLNSVYGYGPKTLTKLYKVIKSVKSNYQNS